ncbi:MAG TPA: hypothetical protein DCM86_18695 [Verrucomicrobiales bacterium]|nr:hypothetical protein [Verrucomicrobiales bacterium]
MFATVFLNAPSWLLPAALLVVAALGLLVLGYRRIPLSPGLRWGCVTLKLLGVLALGLCLLDPLWITQRARPGANFFVVLADNSLSLRIKDAGAAATRGEAQSKLLTGPGAAWQEKLAEDFQLRRYLFDARLQRVDDFAEATFDGKATAFATTARQLRERFQGQPLAGILLFTDGNFTDLPPTGLDTNGLPPVYPVVMGEEMPARDVALTGVTASQTAFEDAPVNAQAEVTAYGYDGEKIVARLTDLSGKTLAEQTETARGAEARIAFRFQFKPETAGLGYYRVRVSARDEAGQFENPASSREATLANNTRVFVVDRGQEPFRVLYLSGRPNWEYKFLHRAIEEDAQVQLVGLIRVARREPKFEFKGRQGESSNPLFRGFGNQSKEEIERYDQPVLIRLNTRDQEELQGGFPKLAKDLFGYHALIIDDLEAEFFTPDQMRLVQQFVTARGGGLMMLGGAETFQQGKYHNTLIGDLLPVYLDSVPAGPPATNNIKLSLTREGFLQPWARLRNQETDERSRLDGMPGFQVLNRVRDFKPGAIVVATAQDDKGTSYPAIATQRFGNGRSAAVLLGDIWRWGMKDPDLRKDMDKSWRQLVRWLVSDVPQRIALDPEPVPGDPNQAVTLRVKARDKEFKPVDNATVSILVKPVGRPGTNTTEVRLGAEPSATDPGVYEAVYVPREAGAYEARASVVTGAGVEEGKTAAGWASNLGNDEFQSLKPNRSLLEHLAKATGGEVISQSGLARFAKELPSRKVPLMETASDPLWHRSMVFLFALACFVLEWGLRRWKGLA